MENRVEKFRQARRNRAKYKLIMILFLIFVLAGIIISDYSFGSLMNGERQIGIIAFKEENSFIEINLMNKKVYIDTGYVQKSLEHIKKTVAKLLGQINLLVS